MSPFDTAHLNFCSTLIETMRLSLSFSRCREHFSKVADFNLPRLHLAPPLGVTPVEFR